MADIGASLHNAIEVYKKNWQKMLFASFVYLLPLLVIYSILLVWVFVAGYTSGTEIFSGFDLIFIILFLILVFVYMYLQLGFTRYLNLYFSKEPKLNEILHFLKYRKLDTLIFVILMTIITMFVFSPLLVLVAISNLESVGSAAFAFILLMLCSLAWLLFLFSGIAYAVEDLSPIDAIKRSFYLVKRNYLTTLLFLFIYYIIIYLISIVAILVVLLIALTIILIPLAMVLIFLFMLFVVSFCSLWLISFYRELMKSEPMTRTEQRVRKGSRRKE